MPKATPQNVIDLGFSATQFNSPADFNAYITAILDDVELEVTEEVSAAVYAAATSGSLNFKRIKTAEVYFTAAELWRRIEQFERANMSVGRGGDQVETISSRMLKNAEEAEAKAWAELAKVTGNDGSTGMAAGHLQSGRLSTVST